MATDRIETIKALLARAEQAHGVYEGTELNGVYDQQWPRWYASYAVEHEISALVGHDVTAEQLAAFLESTNADLEKTDPRPVESWAAYTARRMAAEL